MTDRIGPQPNPPEWSIDDLIQEIAAEAGCTVVDARHSLGLLGIYAAYIRSHDYAPQRVHDGDEVMFHVFSQLRPHCEGVLAKIMDLLIELDRGELRLEFEVIPASNATAAYTVMKIVLVTAN